MMPDRIEVRRAPRGEFVWGFVAGNGELDAHSETFVTRSNAIRAAKRHITKVLQLVGARCAFKTLREGDKTRIFATIVEYPQLGPR